MSPVIEIENLDFSYNNDINVLENINIKVSEKDFVGIIGPNGGGKTTLLKLMLGLLKPVKGRIKVLGTTPQKTTNKIGYVPQYNTTDKLFPINALDVVLMGLADSNSFLPWFSKKQLDRADEVMELVHIQDLRKKTFGELSGGQKQRCLIARAIASSPGILFLDEPTASVDSKVESNIYELLKELNKEVTIVLVSHDLGFVSTYVNKVACVNKKLAFHKTADINSQEINKIYNAEMSMIQHQCGL